MTQAGEMKNTCIICKSPSVPYFTKQFNKTEYSDALLVEYYRCPGCGFVHSSTHQKMIESDWEKLNKSCHIAFESNSISLGINQPPYAEMALALVILSRSDILNIDSVLDYAAGYGTLSKIFLRYFDIEIDCYDKYVIDSSASSPVRYVAKKSLADYSVVINSAMFEHVLSRQSLDDVDDSVARDGVLMLHTVVCENVPANPDWFYFTPIVHCAFHTNKSMAILMSQWGYSDSIYSPPAKSWFLFREGSSVLVDLPDRVDQINKQLQCDFFYYKKGFLDYWKGF